MPRPSSELLSRGNVESQDQTGGSQSSKPPGLLQKFFEGSFDQILKHSKLNRSYRVCGFTVQILGLFYASFFFLFMVVSDN